MISERTEFLISQYVDGTIADDDRAWLESQFATDSDARLLVHEYRKLNDVLAAAPPVPEIDYGALTSRINDAIDDHNARPSYRITTWTARIAGGLAVAAAVALAVGVWTRPFAHHAAVPQIAVHNSSAPAAALVQVAVLRPADDAKLAFGPALQHVVVGPPTRSDVPYASALSDELVRRPNTLFIAKAQQPAQDTPRSLY